MAKRYHNSKKHESKESRAMEKREHHSPVPNVVQRTAKKMRERSMSSENEVTKDMMARDHMLIAEDHNAPANLPRHIVQKYWPKGGTYDLGMIDDLFSGVQKQLHEDDEDMRKAFKPNKY